MVLPNGYTAGPRKFTKLLKPAHATLRKAGNTLAAYLDDIIIFGKTIPKICYTSSQIYICTITNYGVSGICH